MGSYLEMLPLSGIAKYAGGKTKDAIPFAGYPQQHRSDESKIILVHDPMGPSPTVMEFKLKDVLFVEEIPSAVTENGEGIPMIKLWIRLGARGVIFEPFEVNSPINFASKSREIRERFLEK